MISAGDFRKGITLEMENGIWTIVDFQHVKPGKGAAFVRTKIKNIVTGAVLERTFNPTDKSRARTSKPKRWNIFITMASCTISWIWKPTSNCL